MEKQFILVTGASGGIGQAIAIKLARSGYSLYLHYHQNAEVIHYLLLKLEELNPTGEFIPIGADLRTEEGCQKLCQEIYQLAGIVHNGGVAISKMLTSMLTEEINELIQLHLTAPILISKLLLPKMIQQKKGCIVFVSSIWGITGASCETVYSAVKGGQISFAKALSKEVAPSNIRINIVAPGAIETKMLSNLSDEDIEYLRDEIPLARIGQPEEVANAVHFLLSNESSYITGQVLNVNGGWYI